MLSVCLSRLTIRYCIRSKRLNVSSKFIHLLIAQTSDEFTLNHVKTFWKKTLTRNQAVARIADRTASQHLWGSRDVIGHVIISYPMGHMS